MKKLILLAFTIGILSNTYAEDYPYQCNYNKTESRAEKQATKADKQALIALTPEVKVLWKELQKIIATPDFKKYGLQIDAYKHWAKKQNALKEKVRKVFAEGEYFGTDYELCESVFLYGVGFQSDYARTLAIHQDDNNERVIKAKNELLQFIDVLPEAKNQ